MNASRMAARSSWWLALCLAACGDGGGSNPPATEQSCTDGDDEDEDGLTDCADDDCTGDPACAPPVEMCADGTDNDLDSFSDCDDDDCWEDPACYKVDDDVDLTTADGDPALDLDKAGITLVSGTATFFVTTEGTWPPSTGFYSWVLYFEIDNDGNTPVAAVTLQRQDGVDATVVSGIPTANATVRQTPRGVWARMTGVPGIGQKYYVESRVQKTNPGTRVTDTVVGAPAPIP